METFIQYFDENHERVEMLSIGMINQESVPQPPVDDWLPFQVLFPASNNHNILVPDKKYPGVSSEGFNHFQSRSRPLATRRLCSRRHHESDTVGQYYLHGCRYHGPWQSVSTQEQRVTAHVGGWTPPSRATSLWFSQATQAGPMPHEKESRRPIHPRGRVPIVLLSG